MKKFILGVAVLPFLLTGCAGTWEDKYEVTPQDGLNPPRCLTIKHYEWNDWDGEIRNESLPQNYCLSEEPGDQFGPVAPWGEGENE